jgi:hypothetical protein
MALHRRCSRDRLIYLYDQRNRVAITNSARVPAGGVIMKRPGVASSQRVLAVIMQLSACLRVSLIIGAGHRGEGTKGDGSEAVTNVSLPLRLCEMEV